MAVVFMGMQGQRTNTNQHDTIDTDYESIYFNALCGNPPALCKNIRVQYNGNFGYHHCKKC